MHKKNKNKKEKENAENTDTQEISSIQTYAVRRQRLKTKPWPYLELGKVVQ